MFPGMPEFFIQVQVSPIPSHGLARTVSRTVRGVNNQEITEALRLLLDEFQTVQEGLHPDD